MDRIKAALQHWGLAGLPHNHGKSFQEHLLNTGELLAAMRQGPTVQNAGAMHAVYGTGSFNCQPPSRQQVRAVIGAQAELLVHLFCNIDRNFLVFNWEVPRSRLTYVTWQLTSATVGALRAIEVANLMEQGLLRNYPKLTAYATGKGWLPANSS